MDDIDKLIAQIQAYNEAYRRGEPRISDKQYDDLVEKLRQADPSHPFLLMVEPEKFEGRQEVRHPIPMLSIEKAYDEKQLERFINRVKKEAAEIDVQDVLLKVTAKLDGLAGRDDGHIFATRGNGEVGYEISSAFTKGVIPIGGRGQGLGEVVVVKSYFDANMLGKFEHPRNMVVGIISSDTLNENADKALKEGMVHFVPYAQLPSWIGTGEALVQNRDEVIAELFAGIDYQSDGVVVEVTDETVRNHMGATAHHYRWQIAIKSRGETARTIVEGIVWQVGRTGIITPVLMVHPVTLSGATIRRVTAHHAGLIKKNHIGKGAEIEIIRSGEVIPKLEKVYKTADDFSLPDRCPSCDTPLKWNNDFLKCPNPHCTAQVEQGISHWFKTLGSADWFGIKTIQRLVRGGYDTLEKIYRMDRENFLQLGFGPVQSTNLADAIRSSIEKPIEDWRLLAAFGIPNLGLGDSRKILTFIRLEDLLSVSEEDIKQLHGFGDITSRSIEEGLRFMLQTISNMLALGFTLVRTPLRHNLEQIESPIYGKRIVFSGKMEHGNRDQMQDYARSLGANVQTTVTGNTDILVCGTKVGANKIEKARKTGTKIVSEEEFFRIIGNSG